MRVKLEVTKRRISTGKPKDFCLCPVALAVKAVVKRGVNVEVGDGCLTLTHLDFMHCVELPKKAWSFVDAFDNHQPVSPFSVNVDIHAAYLR